MMKFLSISQKQSLVALLGMANILTSQAESLKDPTQPPASLYSETVANNETATGPVLQSVLIGAQYRAAIINGEKVMLGKKYQQATLIKLNEHEAVLRNPDMSTQTLVMDFAIEKKIVSPEVASTTTKYKTKRSPKPIKVSEK
jgi:MSHA biogenesis protein MshK